jgi:hypothetical protein
MRIVALGIQTQVGQAVEEEVQREAHLEPGHVDPEADVRPAAEANVGFGPTEDVEAVRIRPPLLVALGRAEDGHDRGARRDVLASQLGVACRASARRPGTRLDQHLPSYMLAA